MTLRTKLEEVLEMIKSECEGYANPGTHMTEEHYTKCYAKVDALDDVIFRLEQILKETAE